MEEHDHERVVQKEGAGVEVTAAVRAVGMVKPAPIMVDVVTSGHETAGSIGGRLPEQFENETMKEHFEGRREGRSVATGENRAFASLRASTRGA